MSPLETLAVSLVGGVAAAIVTTLGTLWVQGQRHSYADRTRFIDLRRERYSTMLREADEHVRIIKRQHDAVLAWLAESKDSKPPQLASTDPLSHLAAEISLLGRSPVVGDAAEAMYRARFALDQFAWDAEWDPNRWLDWAGKGMNEPLDAYDKARSAFLVAAKQDLGTA